jgi:hypothetical protein
MAEMNIKAQVLGCAAVARPGDTILVGLDRALSDEELEHLVDEFENLTEETGVHIVLLENVTSMTVVRDDRNAGRSTGCGTSAATLRARRAPHTWTTMGASWAPK